MKKMKKITLVLLFVFVLVISTTNVLAAEVESTNEGVEVQRYSIELQTRSALLIDRSGSMEERVEIEEILSKIDMTSYDVVGYFDDDQISLDEEFSGGGNSHICEQIDEMARSGFTHISIVTDAEQYPEKYVKLGVYTDLDIVMYLPEQPSGDSEKFINQLKGRLVNSSLKVVVPGDEQQVILDDYQAPVYTIEIPAQKKETVILESEDSDDDQKLTSDDISKSENVNSIDEAEDNDCKWSLAFLLGVLVAALFDFIHEFITRRVKKNTVTATKVTPMPQPVVDKIANGYQIVADFSGSMAKQQAATVQACEKAGTLEKVICFGDTVTEEEVSNISKISAGGGTPGWEALEQAAEKGCENLLIVSDLDFNGKMFEESKFPKKFKNITVVTPKRHNRSVLTDIEKIAEEVEVISL